MKPLREIIKPDIDGYLCVDRPENWLYNSIMFFAPKNKFILNCIKKTVKNFLDGELNYYKPEFIKKTIFKLDTGIYAMSGPIMCGEQFLKYANICKIESNIYQIDDKKISTEITYSFGDSNQIRLNKELIIIKDFPNYRVRTNGSDYVRMYNNRTVFVRKDGEKIK